MKELKQETRITMTLMFNKFTQPFFFLMIFFTHFTTEIMFMIIE